MTDAASSSLPPAILLLGPTASGKTAAALALAEHLPIEIISVDSALVYRDMDIGTAKPSAAEQAQCPHHLIDLISPEESYSAAQFRRDAIRLMREISARGRIPVLAGGTMLYYKALRDGLAELPSADATLRAQIDQDAAELGWPALHARLAELDPDSAQRLAPYDAQRIQRALELVLVTGRPVGELYAQAPIEGEALAHRLISIALTPSDRSMLHTRIEQRFDHMLDNGLIEEVAHVRRHYELTPNLPSMRCVGYRQVWDYLDGTSSYADMRYKGIVATRQLAKRQMTWQRQFRENWPDWYELDCLDPLLNTAVCARVERALG